MLNRCNALIFSADGRWSEAFCSNLKTVGFTRIFSVCDFDDLDRSLSRQCVNYCFFSQGSQFEQIQAAVRAIRGYRDDELRFSPSILMARELSRESLGHYASVGFDDIIQFPCTIEMLRTRVKRQLNSELRYYETQDYFGPDRRNSISSKPRKDSRRTGMVPYRRHSIRRDVFKVVEVVDVFDHKPPSFVVEEAEVE